MHGSKIIMEQKRLYMKKQNIFFSLLFLLVCCACQQPDDFERSTNNTISSIQATLADGKGLFTAEGEAPYGDTIRIVLPYYFPEESDNEISADKLIVSAVLPNSTTVFPKLGLMNLSKPIDLEVSASNGTVRHHVLVADIRKSDKAEILGFKLNEAGLEGTISASEKKIYIQGFLEDVKAQTATVKLSPHATIYPDPSVVRDYSEPIEYTVTAHNGRQEVYTVEMGEPEKAEHGFTTSKLLWKKGYSEMHAFEDYRQIGIAVSGDYLVIPVSNEWAATTAIPYYNRFNGEHEGSLSLTCKDGSSVYNIFQVANDEKGHILAMNLVFAYSWTANVTLWKWDDVKATPEPFIVWQQTDNTKDIGRKLSIQGDLSGDAMIYATISNSTKVLRWEVKGGVPVSHDPEILTIGVSDWSYVAKAEPTGNLKTNDWILGGVGLRPAIYTGTDRKAEMDESALLGGGYVPGMRVFTFNNAKYMALTDCSISDGGWLQIYDISKESDFSMKRSDEKFRNFNVFTSPKMSAGATQNVNVTGEIAVSGLSEDGFTMIVYCLMTNCELVAYELNCIAIK